MSPVNLLRLVSRVFSGLRTPAAGATGALGLHHTREEYFRTPQDVERVLKLPVLATCPSRGESRRKGGR